MSRVSSSLQCDSVASYMDGLQVKIAEAYKPPRKIGLPAACNNKLPDVSKYCYDFSLEKNVVKKMSVWKKIRQNRIERNREKQNNSSGPSPVPPSSPQQEFNHQLPVKNAPVLETTILTPQLHIPVNDDVQIKSDQLNYADFDNDTSSPFDNVLLKTINDKEELAQVLQPTQWKLSGELSNTINDMILNDEEENGEIHNLEMRDESTNVETESQERKKEENETEQRIVSSIIKELQEELERSIVRNGKVWPNIENMEEEKVCTQNCDVIVTPNHSRMSTILDNLSKDDEKLARHLSDMGFPLGRVARAIRILGGSDNKKIIEYLLAVQSLEDDFGISEESAKKALEITQYDLEKAKKFQKNLFTLKDLGFPEDQASTALLKCDIDRDEALDFLIT